MEKEDYLLYFFTLVLCIFLLVLEPVLKQDMKDVKHDTTKLESSTRIPDSQSTMLPTAEPTPTELQEKFFTNINIKMKIREDILQNLKLHGASKEVVKEELLIYANGSGESGADTVSDMAEMTVDYAKETITIPCYFATGNNHSVKFDMIFNYTKKTFDFIPW